MTGTYDRNRLAQFHRAMACRAGPRHRRGATIQSARFVKVSTNPAPRRSGVGKRPRPPADIDADPGPVRIAAAALFDQARIRSRGFRRHHRADLAALPADRAVANPRRPRPCPPQQQPSCGFAHLGAVPGPQEQAARSLPSPARSRARQGLEIPGAGDPAPSVPRPANPPLHIGGSLRTGTKPEPGIVPACWPPAPRPARRPAPAHCAAHAPQPRPTPCPRNLRPAGYRVPGKAKPRRMR